ncbi:DUF455 domain-containing protein [Lujinxingia litoralis]|uniref:DUF455 domain-containing protein n=1 Tax=Lujinxingia litoralis TaxID=2211119 RepID=A0A328C6J1_9DELT|nr:DUF455 family protein [Lujinxingia litoralis]RAL21817.1 DUF455 domain-containing protein [Lujinxingia litoralis]
MRLRDFAERLLHATTLEQKLMPPEGGYAALTDHDPGEPRAWSAPGRPPELEIAPRRHRFKFPHPDNLAEPEMAVRALHTFANHELMAIELMAWALLAYPEAPASFRAGMVRLIADEQCHLKLYADRIAELGARFGDLPVNDHFWRCAPSLTSPLKWVCAMNLTFEQGNLDHAPYFEEQFRRVGDLKTAQILEKIFEDEIHHVGFGASWLRQNTPQGQSSFEIYCQNLTFHNEPARARGANFNPEARRRAGLDEDFVAGMRRAT